MGLKKYSGISKMKQLFRLISHLLFEYRMASKRFGIPKISTKQFEVYQVFSEKESDCIFEPLRNKASLEGQSVFKTNRRIISLTSCEMRYKVTKMFWTLS